MNKPTCEQLWNEEFGESVHRESDDSWRHGCRITEVFHRETDDTHWQARYCQSTDGETNELREGLAEITQVKPEQKIHTVYTPLTLPIT